MARRTASPANTVPMTHFWARSQCGLSLNQIAMRAANSVISRLTLKLVVIWIMPSVTLCQNTEPCSALTNCGKMDR